MAESHKKKGPPKPSVALVVIAALVLIALCFVVPRVGGWWSAQREDEPKEVEASSPEVRARGVPGNQAEAEPVKVEPAEPIELYVRKPLEAPARTEDWSTVVHGPSGYRPMFCEADESLACTSTEADMTKVRFVFDCRDLRGSAAIREQEADLIACRVRAKGDEALSLATWYEPY